MGRRRQRSSLAWLLLAVLLALCLCAPTVADTSSKSKKSAASTSQPPSQSSATPASSSASTASTSASASASTPASPAAGAGDARQQRLERKQKRQEAGSKRTEQQSKRAADKTRKQTKKHAEQRKKRQEKDSKRESRLQKVKERTEAYWTARTAATQPASVEKGEARLQKLSALSATSPLVQLRERQFEEFVVGSPRPYWLLASLTALDRKYECRICELVHQAFVAAAPTVTAYSSELLNSTDSPLSAGNYNTLLSFNGSVAASQREQLQRDHDERAKRALPVFVAELDIDNARNVFNVLQLTTAPVVFLLPPSFAPKAPQMANLLSGLASKYKFVPQTLDIHAKTMIDFINGHVDNKLSSAPTGGPAGLDGVAGVLQSIKDRISGFQPVILIYFSIILASLLLFLLTQLASAYWKRAPSPVATVVDPQQPQLAGAAPVADSDSSSLLSYLFPSSTVNAYNPSASSIATLNFYSVSRLLRTLPLVVAGVTFYLFCVSGGMFTIIKDTDSGYSVSSSGKWEFKQWISGQYMDQTVVESTVLATLYLTLTALFVLLNSRTFHRPSPDASSLSASSVAGWLSSWLVSPLWIVLLGVFVYLQLVNVYMRKTSYNWGVNWRWLKAVNWQKTIPSPVFHRYLRMLWAEVQKRFI